MSTQKKSPEVVAAWKISRRNVLTGSAAVAKAVHNTCGVRIRELPLTLNKVLAGKDAAMMKA